MTIKGYIWVIYGLSTGYLRVIYGLSMGYLWVVRQDDRHISYMSCTEKTLQVRRYSWYGFT